MEDTRTWSDLAQECEAKGIKYSQKDDAEALRKKLATKATGKPAKKS